MQSIGGNTSWGMERKMDDQQERLTAEVIIILDRIANSLEHLGTESTWIKEAIREILYIEQTREDDDPEG